MSFDDRIVRYEDLHSVQKEDFDVLCAAAQVADGARVLDLGCGYGACTREILLRLSPGVAASFDLLDESQRQLDRTYAELAAWERDADTRWARLRFQRIRGHFPDVGRQDGAYDVVVAKMVLHEMPREEQEAFLRAIWHALKPNGVFVLWDLCLTSGTHDFFRQAIRRKDELVGYADLATRRHFPAGAELPVLLDAAGFAYARVVKFIDYFADSTRRLMSEFHGDQNLYQRWLGDVRSIASRTLSDEGATELRLQDEGERITFHVQKAIIAARRPGADSITQMSLGNGDGPVAARSLYDPAIAFPRIVQSTLTSKAGSPFGQVGKALMRPAILTRSYSGRLELCREGLDYLCNYMADSLGATRQLSAYVAYLAAVYSLSQGGDGTSGGQGMSGALTKVLSDYSGTAWLSVQAIEPGTENSPVEVRLGGYDFVAGVARIRFRDTIAPFFHIAMDMLEPSAWPRAQLCGMDIERVTGPVGKASLDLVARSLAERLRELGHHALQSAVNTPPAIEWRLQTERLQAFLAHTGVLLAIQQYLVHSGTPVCHYVCPPSIVTDEGRLEGGALVLATTAPPSSEALGSSLQFVVRLWSGLGAVEGILAEQFRQERERDRELARSAYGVGHFLGNRLIETRASTDILRRKPVGSQVTADTRRKAEQAFYQADATFKTARLMHFMANLITRAANDRLETRFYQNEAYSITTGLRKMLHACNSAEGTSLSLSPSSLDDCETLAIVGFVDADGTRVRFFNELYDELVFEVLYNASKYGLQGQCVVSIHVDDTLLRAWPSARAAMIISNKCDGPPRVEEICRHNMSNGGWSAVDSRRDTGLGFLQSCLQLSDGGAIYVRGITEGDQYRFQLRVELAGLTRNGATNGEYR